MIYGSEDKRAEESLNFACFCEDRALQSGSLLMDD